MKTTVASGGVIAVFALSAGSAMSGTVAAQKTTVENLQAAFEGESNARARYEAFASKADSEGYAGVASLFRAAAKAESVHAERHAKVLAAKGVQAKTEIRTPDVRSTAENLATARKGEDYERDVMYPAFIDRAKADGDSAAADSFADARSVEAVHSRLYASAAADLDGWRTARAFHVCSNCGNTMEDLALDRCPICSKPRSWFARVD